jgi:mRNA interferase RelE/StbE
MYQVKLSKQAVKMIKKLNEPVLSKVKSKLKSLENWPIKADVKAMKGNYKGYYRLRIGNIRVIFYPDPKSKVIYIDAIGFRGDMY